VETELPAGQIAGTPGFEDVQHVARCFSAGQGFKTAGPLQDARPETRGKPHSQTGDSFSQSGAAFF